MTDEQIIAAAGEPEKYLIERMQTVCDGMKAGLDDWPIASHIWEYEQAIQTINRLISAAKSLRERLVELEANASTMKAYYDQVFEDGGKRIAELTKQLSNYKMDAERYHFLKNDKYFWTEIEHILCCSDNLDIEIDKARKTS